MSKDPATLWYWNDWITGTMVFTRHEKGCYMDLLGAQFNNGHLTLDQIKNVLGNDFAKWGVLSKKFVQDSNGLWYNEKADETLNKRRAFTKSRKDNLSGLTSMGAHMEIRIEERKLEFKNKVKEFQTEFDVELLKKFYDYWTEHNEGGKKMLFEMKKTFDIKKRLNRWKSNELNFNKNGKSTAETRRQSVDDMANLARKVLGEG
jgi:hypothetical protein